VAEADKLSQTIQNIKVALFLSISFAWFLITAIILPGLRHPWTKDDNLNIVINLATIVCFMALAGVYFLNVNPKQKKPLQR